MGVLASVRLLIAEDDPGIRSAYGTFLASRGFQVLEAPDGPKAVERAALADLVLLDVMMPGLSGWEVAERLNERYPDKPVLMLTALGASEHKLHGFEMGADDYLVKPVDLHELEARVRAVMRRCGIGKVLTRGKLKIDPARRTATVNGNRLDLTPLEFQLMYRLASRPGRVWSRSELLRSVWGEDYFGVDRTVDVRVAGLRRKLASNGASERFIETIRNHGYRFVNPEFE